MTFFVVIVVVPLAAAGLLVRGAIAREVDRRTDLKLEGEVQALGAAWLLLQQPVAANTREAAGDVAAELGRVPHIGLTRLERLLAQVRDRRGLEFLTVRTSDGTIAGSILGVTFLSPRIHFSPETIIDPGRLAPLLIPTTVALQRSGREAGTVYGGSFLDQDEAGELSQLAGGVQFQVVVDGQLTAASPSLVRPLRLPSPRIGTFDVPGAGRGVYSRVVQLDEASGPGGFVVVNRPETDVGSLQAAILVVLGGSVLLAAVLGYGLARAISAPIRKLADEATAALPAGRQPAQKPRSADEVAALATTFSAMTEHLQHAERLSMTDPLTGIGNRRFLEVTLAREVERARRYGRGLAVLMADIDRFKAVNDRLGHERGDQVLVDVCRRMESSIRSEIDTLVRYGGEEFVVVMPESTEEGAVAAAERMRQVVSGAPFGAAEGDPLNVTISVGVASYPRDGRTAENLVRAADLSMYQAKRLGRNRVASAFLG